MDIHQPKPWRGAREFLKEIGTIVIGVLIALGGEQAVEWLHTRELIAQARDALHDEISQNATTAVAALVEERCTLAWFDRFAGWAKGGARPDILSAPDVLATYGTTVWDIAKSGAVTHMSLKEQLDYARVYARTQNINSVVEHQRTDAQRLVGYWGQGVLTPAQATALSEAISTTKPLVRVQLENLPRLVEAARAAGAGPRPMSAEVRGRMEALCVSLGAAPPQWPAAGG